MMAEEKIKEVDNIVYIGTKPFMNYVTSVVMQFTTKNMHEVIIKARGKFINRAVDVAEVVKKKFLEKQEIDVNDIKIDSEEFEDKNGKKVNVSTIEITLSKKK
jgi:DNA-binding protein